MGYSYGMNERGNMVLSCDGCGAVGGVRKRTCPFKVTTASHRTGDGQRHAIAYCYPPALCAKCFAAEGGTKGVHGTSCRDGAAASQARYDAEQAKLDAGDKMVRSAFGAWHKNVPNGKVGVLFYGPDGVKVAVLIPSQEYTGAKQFLSDYDNVEPWDDYDN